MRFRTTSHPVAHLFTGDITSRSHLSCVFNMGELYLPDGYSIIVILPLDQDIVRLDICGASATGQTVFERGSKDYRCEQCCDGVGLWAHAVCL
jgi:hypothetical protein